MSASGIPVNFSSAIDDEKLAMREGEKAGFQLFQLFGNEGIERKLF